MPVGSETIHGGGLNFAFTVYGTNTLRYANQFVQNVNALLVNENVTIVNAGQADRYVPGHVPGNSTPVYELVPSTVQGGTQDFFVPGAGYVLDSIGGANTVSTFGSGGDTILVAQINARATINTSGSNNLVIFVDGNNTFNGSQTGGNETVVAGTGFDTINTGTGLTTVNSGTGDATIYLNDTAQGAFNDKVWLDDGHSLVIANGTGDVVVATTEGQTIVGGPGETSNSALTVALLPNSDGTANGNDLINAGAGYTNVVDESSNNTINGGAGGLTFIGGDSVTASINTGAGYSIIFGNVGESLTLTTQAGDTGGSTFIAGAGNESLLGGGATASILAFGGQDSAGNDSIVTGAGNDTLVAGLGNETLAGGTGNNTFLIDATASAGANVVLSDFGNNLAGDSIAFSGFSAQDVQQALDNGQEVNGNFVITLSDSTTVTFAGVSSESQLNGHIITF
jgi:Ca2+-binding RTX toxin-like protein